MFNKTFAAWLYSSVIGSGITFALWQHNMWAGAFAVCFIVACTFIAAVIKVW